MERERAACFKGSGERIERICRNTIIEWYKKVKRWMENGRDSEEGVIDREREGSGE